MIIPSFKTAQQVDVRFEQKAAPELPKYIHAVDEDPSNPVRAMKLSYLDQQVTQMKQSLESIDNALNDRRLRYARDPVTARLRTRLQDLYDAQSARANILWEFLMRERTKIARRDIAALTITNNGAPGGPATPDPRTTPTPFAMPSLTGLTMQDERTMSEWARSLTAAVSETETTTATAVTGLASNCG